MLLGFQRITVSFKFHLWGLLL